MIIQIELADYIINFNTKLKEAITLVWTGSKVLKGFDNIDLFCNIIHNSS